MAQNWTFVGSGTVQVGNTTPSIPVPTGYASGDLLVICWTDTSTLPATPSGWTALTGNASRLAVFYKFAGASESSVSLTGSAGTTSVMIAYRNISTYDSVSTAVSLSSTTVSTNTLTTVNNDEIIISLYSCGSTGSTWTAPSETTTRVNQKGQGSGGGYRGILIVDENKATAGTSTARTATNAISNTLNAISVSFSQTAAVVTTGNFFRMF